MRYHLNGREVRLRAPYDLILLRLVFSPGRAFQQEDLIGAWDDPPLAVCGGRALSYIKRRINLAVGCEYVKQDRRGIYVERLG